MPDAIALVRPRSRDALLPHLDLDEESEESEGIYAEELADGAFLLHTFQPFALFVEHPREARTWLLEELGDDLRGAHDDPRGMLFFDEDDLPEASSYDAIATALEGRGLWITVTDELDEDEGELDLSAVAELAGQLFDPTRQGQSASSFEIGQMLEGMQRQLMESLGVDPERLGQEPDAADDEPSVVDEEFEPEPPPGKKK